MEHEIPKARSMTNDTEKVAGNLPCIRCAYNLRGLPRDSVCPECANPIRYALRGNRLIHSAPHWLIRLRRGTVLMLLCVLAFESLEISKHIFHAEPFELRIIQTVGIVFSLLFIAAVFLLTTREPITYGAKEPTFLRMFIRTAAIVSLAGKLIALAPFTRAGMMPDIITFAFSVGSPVAGIGTLVILRRLARRIPDDMLAMTTGVLIWGAIISLTLQTTFATAIFTGNANTRNLNTYTTFSLVGCGMVILGILLTILHIHAMRSYYKAFKSAAVHSTTR